MTEQPLVVVQARAGSTRLPGKVLAPIGDRPMLGLMLARLAPLADRAHLVLATTVHDRDDPVAAVAAEAGWAVVRGDEDDVLGRFVEALGRHRADDVVRLTADCPLIDPAVVAAALDLHRRTGADYTSNTLVRTFPDGLDVEVLRADVLRAAAAEAPPGPEREHVTPFAYRRPRRFTLAQLTTPELAGAERWTVDRAEDLDAVRAAVDRLDDPVAAGWREVLAAFGRHAPGPAGGVRAIPVAGIEHRRGEPYLRRWDLEAGGDGEQVGRAEVWTDAGVGELAIDLEPTARAHRPAVVDAVRTWLDADLQITDLRDPEGPQP